jgi:hypothetical protein
VGGGGEEERRRGSERREGETGRAWREEWYVHSSGPYQIRGGGTGSTALYVCMYTEFCRIGQRDSRTLLYSVPRGEGGWCY